MAELNAAIANSTIGLVGLAFDDSGKPVIRNKKVEPIPDPKSIPFYIDVRGPVTLAATSGLQMSTDGTNWTDTAATTLSSGKTYFRVANDQSTPLKPAWTEDDNSDYDIGGNINSLVKVGFENNTTSYSFSSYFQNKNKLKSASDLILPATTLVANCYKQMFQGCTSLTTAPELPATTLANYCYQNMFDGCASLTAAPVLPATTLAQYCYQSMFSYCTSLTTAPELPATTLVDYCYKEMFRSCTSLTTAPELPATTLVNQCYRSMFDACRALTTAPELPATKLVDYCYYHMFNGCTNLNYIKCLATNIPQFGNTTTVWVYGVAATGTFVKDPSMSGWTTDNNGIPTGWTVEDATE